MKKQVLVMTLVAAAVIGGTGYGMYRLGMDRGMDMAKPAASSAGVARQPGTDSSLVDPKTGRKVLYWHDPMAPGQKFDKPGKSPFMDMELVPVYADEAGGEGGVSINPTVQQNLGLRTAEVTKTRLTLGVEAVGSVAYNERSVALVPARSNGFVEKLYVRAPLDPVKKGQVLAELYAPEWVGAQEEYLSIKRMQGAGAEGLLDAARQRLRLAGMTDDQIRKVEASGRVHARLPIVSPISGVVAELSVREGMTVMAGAPLFRINGLDTIWVHAEIPENVAAQVRVGNTVKARSPSLPESTFDGKVSAILPEINAATRTIKARIELDNPKQQLVPGMFVTVNLTPNKQEEVLAVPSEAVIQTGKRSVVILNDEKAGFIPVEVELGTDANGQTEIRKGLQAGQKVVVSGQFLVDSEASLKGVLARMGAKPVEEGKKATVSLTHQGTGKIESIDQSEITISHGPIPSLKWSAMTMGFKPPPGGIPKGLKVGDEVTFSVRAMDDGMYEIVEIKPSGQGTATQHDAPVTHEGHAK